MSATVRGLAVALAVALAGLALRQAIARRAQHQAVLELLADTGLPTREPEVARAVATDPDPVRARLSVARALLAEAFDYSPFETLPLRDAVEEAARVSERLELAREIAAGALAERPSSWQAAMILGGATYRMWSSRGDPRTLTDRAAWEGPLRAAARLAPGEDEPLRFLAVAWLEVWPALSEIERNGARATLRRAFMDPETFARCAELWLATTPDRDEAFSLVPGDSRAWSVLEGVYAGGTQWEGFCAARQRRDAALEGELRRRLAEADAHLRGGDRAGARSLALGVVAAAPVELRFRDIVKSALALCPAGPMGSPEVFHRWLSWALEGSLRGQTRLPPETVGRLAGAAGELPPAEAALSLLASGNRAQAEVIERRSEAPATEAWAAYWLTKARVLAAQPRGTEAAVALERVHRNWRNAVPAVEARLAVAQATRDQVGLAAARAEVAALAGTSWTATGWQWHGPVARLDLLAAASAPGLAVRFDVVPAAGAAVKISLDGATVAVAPVGGGGKAQVAVSVDRGPHLLEVETIAGGRAVPGEVSLAVD